MTKGFKRDKIGQRLKTMTDIRNHKGDSAIICGNLRNTGLAYKSPMEIRRISKRIPK